MGICDSTMGVSNILLVMFFLFHGASPIVKTRAYFSETGDLPCHFTNTQNISVDELVVFWQDQNKQVLYELYKGKENSQNVHHVFKNRTSLDQNSWTLRLHNVQIKDSGSYQCYIHHKGARGLVSLYQSSCDLSVLANFSQPEIILISNRTEDSDNINLTCLSTQGYPKPKKMFFVLKTKNSTTEYDAAMNIFQNDTTKLYNVSASFSFPVSPETNVSIFCVLQPESTQTQLLSQPYNIDAKSPKPHPSSPVRDLLITAVPILLLIGLGPVVYLIQKKRKKQQPDPRHECETINMKGEESE